MMEMRMILEHVCELERADMATMLSKVRSDTVCRVRDIAVYYMYEAGYTYPQITKFFGRESHSTFIYAKRRGKDWLQTMEKFVESLDNDEREKLIKIIDERKQQDGNRQQPADPLSTHNA